MKRLLLFLAALTVALAATAENITVATINVWSGLTYQGVFRSREYEDPATREFRFDLLTRGLASLSPDVVALQEANPLPAYVERLAGELAYDSVYAVRQAGVRVGPVGLPTNLREGSAIIARKEWALTGLEPTQLAGPAAGNVAAFQFGASTQLLAAQIEVAGRMVHVFTTRWTPSPHADRDRLVELVDRYDGGRMDGGDLVDQVRDAVAGSQRRQQEARRTLVTINEMAGEQPVILAGSLFALPDSPEIELLRDAGFIDVWSSVGRGAGLTFDSQTNSNIIEHDLASPGEARERIDYIFVRGQGIAPRSAAIIFSRPTYGVHASSHYGLVAELRIDPEQ